MSTILIADDEARIRRLVSDFLKRDGHTIVEAADGKEALNILENRRPGLDMAILDVMMPGMDGFEVLRELREQEHGETHLPVMLLTARAEDADQVRGLEGGADDYVTKPFSPIVLAARVRTLLKREGRASAPLEQLGKHTQFVDGLRVTDAETADVVQMVLAGKINKTLVNLIGHKGGRAIGLSGIDGQMIQARVRDKRLGYVGEITKVDVRPILDVIDKGYIPVVSTVGCDTQGHVYNINADTAAARIAGELGAESLIAMTDISGILRDKDDPSTLIPVIHTADALQLIESGVINGGMLPKVTCCIDAIRWGVHRVFIIDGRVPHAILIEMLTNEGIGTMFVAGQGGKTDEHSAT